MDRIAVVLFNLGGPDSQESVQPFLKNLFNDPAIISLPGFLRGPLSSLIAWRRAPEATKIYEELGGGSPLLANTQKQADALITELQDSYKDTQWKSFICMRYWHPMAPQVVAEVKKWQPTKIVLIPLYPQFSTTTTGSSFDDWDREAERQGLRGAYVRRVCCYPEMPGFIKTTTTETAERLKQMDASKTRVLFSAHGLPESIVKAGDPYVWQVKKTADSVVNKLPYKNLDWRVCFQSRVGPLPWVKPYTDEEIKQAGAENKNVLLVPLAFVSEHSETLVELDVEYAELAKEAGVPAYQRTPTASVSSSFISGLASLVKTTLDKGQKLNSPYPQCPMEFSQCYCRNFKNF